MKKIFAIVLFLLLSACSTVTVLHTEKMPPIKPTAKGSNSFFVAGIGQEQVIDVKEVCGDRGYKFKSYYSFIDGVLAVITFGIYTPNSYEIYCDKIRK